MKNLIDLHLHLDGSLSVKSVRQLAAQANIVVPESDAELLERLQVSEGCRDLNEYLEKFAFPCSLLQTKQNISTAFYNLCQELQNSGLIYAEIRFAPQLHCNEGLSQSEVVCAALEGCRKSDFKSNLILCCMRGEGNENKNLETLEVAAQFFDKGVCAVDLAGAEAIFKTEKYEELFNIASKKGLRYTIHAGEADGAGSVKKALEYGAARIGHGVRAVEDKELIEYLVKKQIPLEMCPTSNLNTAMFESLSDYPAKMLLEKGCVVTINTDNMTVSNTNLSNEFEKLAEALKLTEEQVHQLQLNAAKAAFCDDVTREWLINKING